LFATGVVYTGGKFAVGVIDTGGKFATVSTVSTALAKLVEKVAAGVLDTEPVSMIPVVYLDLRISP
jgi:hypothetical protein